LVFEQKEILLRCQVAVNPENALQIAAGKSAIDVLTMNSAIAEVAPMLLPFEKIRTILRGSI